MDFQLLGPTVYIYAFFFLRHSETVSFDEKCPVNRIDISLDLLE